MEEQAMHRLVKRTIRRALPTPLFYILYRRAARRLGDASDARHKLYRQLIDESMGLTCLQIGVRDAKLAPHWVSVDLYDESDLIDFHYDVQDLQFADESFDVVVCNAVLEHVEFPEQAIGELKRVLRPGGRIWVEVPFNQPYHASPSDFWRVTPSGLRIWMRDFEETALGFFTIYGCPIDTGVFYFGRKPKGNARGDSTLQR